MSRELHVCITERFLSDFVGSYCNSIDFAALFEMVSEFGYSCLIVNIFDKD